MNGILRFIRRLAGLFRSEFTLASFEAGRCGKGTIIGTGVQLSRPAAISTGRRCVIGEQSWLNTNHDDPGLSVIMIGDYSFIGRRNFFNAGRKIVIGPFCLTGPDCQFLGSDHKWETPFHPYISTGSTLEDDIVLGPNVWLGARVTILKGVSIGFGSIIGAGAIVTDDVPPWSIAIGQPARIVRRFDKIKNVWVPMEEWTVEAEQAIPDEKDYLADLRASHPRVHMSPSAGGASIQHS